MVLCSKKTRKLSFNKYPVYFLSSNFEDLLNVRTCKFDVVYPKKLQKCPLCTRSLNCRDFFVLRRWILLYQKFLFYNVEKKSFSDNIDTSWFLSSVHFDEYSSEAFLDFWLIEASFLPVWSNCLVYIQECMLRIFFARNGNSQ